MVDRWPDWPAQALLVIGPEGCGKTHLANVWRLAADAATVDAATASPQAIESAALAGNVVIENAERSAGNEKALFHLLNLAREQRTSILLTARSRPGTWRIGLPDLRSRIRSLPVAEIAPPDEALIRAVLVKLLSDRQLPATPHAVNHLARHTERSMAAVLAVVEEIDRMLWERPKEVTRALAREALARLDTAPGGA